MKLHFWRTLKLGCSVAALSASWALSAAGDGNHLPAPNPASPQNIAEAYKVLLTRSIFARDSRAATGGRSWRERASADTQPAPTTAPATSIPTPEASLVLKGITEEDGVYNAFFEQTTDSSAVRRRCGESIARGQISAMSLDGVEYQLDGKSSHISIGQALDGRVVDPPKSISTTPSSSPSNSSGGKPSWWGRHSQQSAAPTPPLPKTSSASSPATNPSTADARDPSKPSPAPEARDLPDVEAGVPLPDNAPAQIDISPIIPR